MKDDKKGFYVLQSEEEFDRFMTALLSSIGSIVVQDPNRTREEVDELMDLTMHNVMFLCAEYHGLVSDGKIPPIEQPKDMTWEQAREEVMKQLQSVELFFKTAELKKKEEDGRKTDTENDD